METYLKTLLETESCLLSNMASVVRKCVFIYSRRSQTAASKTPHRKKTTEDSEYNSTNSLLLKNIINHSLQACKMQFSNTWRGLFFSLLRTFMYKQRNVQELKTAVRHSHRDTPQKKNRGGTGSSAAEILQGAMLAPRVWELKSAREEENGRTCPNCDYSK